MNLGQGLNMCIKGMEYELRRLLCTLLEKNVVFYSVEMSIESIMGVEKELSKVSELTYLMKFGERVSKLYLDVLFKKGLMEVDMLEICIVDILENGKVKILLGVRVLLKGVYRELCSVGGYRALRLENERVFEVCDEMLSSSNKEKGRINYVLTGYHKRYNNFVAEFPFPGCGDIPIQLFEHSHRHCNVLGEVCDKEIFFLNTYLRLNSIYYNNGLLYIKGSGKQSYRMLMSLRELLEKYLKRIKSYLLSYFRDQLREEDMEGLDSYEDTGELKGTLCAIDFRKDVVEIRNGYYDVSLKKVIKKGSKEYESYTKLKTCNYYDISLKEGLCSCIYEYHDDCYERSNYFKRFRRNMSRKDCEYYRFSIYVSYISGDYLFEVEDDLDEAGIAQW